MTRPVEGWRPDPRPGGAAAARPSLPARAGLCLAASILLMWPMLLVTAPMVLHDTASYAMTGAYWLGRILETIAPQPEAPAGAASAAGGEGGAAEGDGARFLRSAYWSLYFAAMGGLRWGAVAACAAQTAMTLLVVWAMAPREASPRRLLVLALPVGLLSGLPWYAAYAMPDILGALVIAYYAALVGPFDGLGRVERLVLGVLATFAISVHYGHLPLAGGLALLVLLVRVRRLGPALAAAALLPPALAVAANMLVAVVVDGLGPLPRSEVVAVPSSPEDRAAPRLPALASVPSVTPGRLPVLLARSIEDGPGLWHLREACARDAYRSCALLDPLPETASALLWTEAGVRGLSSRELAVLRAEETAIVLGALRAYPLAQGGALLRNVGLQLVKVGTDDLLPRRPDDGRPERRERAAYPALGIADLTIPVFTALAALALFARLVRGRTHPALVGPVLIVVAGLLANAVIYGGLSYPVDRYQGRLAWLLPALLAMDLAVRPLRRGA